MYSTRQQEVVVRRSRPGLGRGLFAVRPFPKGAFVVEYTGVQIPTRYADTLKTRYLFELDQEWTIDGSSRENVGRYVNHSCEPNCEAEVHDDHILIVALRDIARGEELTIDYGDEYFDEFIRPVGCKCSKCVSGRADEDACKEYQCASENDLHDRKPKT